MPVFEILFLVVLAGYVGLILIALIGSQKKFPKLPEDSLPSATVIVAARNEERNILRCLQSLALLDYPEGKLEIIIVDDHSTDKTPEIIAAFIENKPNIKLIACRKEIGRLQGKTNALANGLEIAAGEIILTTDADCEVSPSWAKTIASYYVGEVSVVNGYTAQLATDNFSGMQNLDFLYLLCVAGGTINMDIPISCIGNNMSYRISAYREVGGYENLPFSVTEDFNLMFAIHKLGKHKIILPFDAGSLVTSLPCPDIRSLYRQKKRWSVGGLKVPPRGYIIMVIGFMTHLLLLLSPFFFSPAVAVMMFFKCLLDYMLLRLVSTSLKIPRSMRYFAAFQLYYIIYVLMIPFVLLTSRKVVWKDRSF